MEQRRCIGWYGGVRIVVGVFLFCVTAVEGQITSLRPWERQVVMPQSRRAAFVFNRKEIAVDITEVIGTVRINGQVASTTLEVRLKNSSSHRKEAELVMPVPEGAVISGFTYEGAGQ